MNNVSKSDIISDLHRLLDQLHYANTHDPQRHETTDGLDNQNLTNEKRANLALPSLRAFQATCKIHEEIDTILSDLICDLLHHAHSLGYEPLLVITSAIRNFCAETTYIKR